MDLACCSLAVTQSAGRCPGRCLKGAKKKELRQVKMTTVEAVVAWCPHPCTTGCACWEHCGSGLEVAVAAPAKAWRIGMAFAIAADVTVEAAFDSENRVRLADHLVASGMKMTEGRTAREEEEDDLVACPAILPLCARPGHSPKIKAAAAIAAAFLLVGCPLLAYSHLAVRPVAAAAVPAVGSACAAGAPVAPASAPVKGVVVVVPASAPVKGVVVVVPAVVVVVVATAVVAVVFELVMVAAAAAGAAVA